jgi:hypothetical protein
LNGISISPRVARNPVSGEISEIPVEKKNLGLEHMQVQLVGEAMKQYIGTVWPHQCVT